ncbi:hypothetical protein C8R44DRAFT_866322 [Mycena epipterygia]|nr:hypothetical protein C8R44DRAFT_866322 [Mycena epipterygia]
MSWMTMVSRIHGHSACAPGGIHLVLKTTSDPNSRSFRAKSLTAPYKREGSSSSQGLSSTSRPVKRQRREERGKDDHKPRIKKENAVVALPEDVLAAYLGGAQSREIKPLANDTLAFSRQFLRVHFGFHPQDLIFNLKSVRTLQGRYAGRAVICGTRRINPHLPTRPDYPGLMCSVRQAMVNGLPRSVFLQTKVAGKALWLYLGEYVFLLVGSMTAAQFADQNDAFHEAWADKILRTVKFDEYVRMHEIGLRRSGYDITKENIATEMAQIRNKQGLAVTGAEVVETLRRGEQQISMVRMECASYDHTFAHDIAAVHEEHA